MTHLIRQTLAPLAASLLLLPFVGCSETSSSVSQAITGGEANLGDSSVAGGSIVTQADSGKAFGGASNPGHGGSLAGSPSEFAGSSGGGAPGVGAAAGAGTGSNPAGSAGAPSAGAGAPSGGAGAPSASAGAPSASAGAPSASAGAPSASAGAPSAGAGTSGVGGASNGSSYSTTFDQAESPISQAGKWKQNGLDWTRVITSGGLAYGTQQGTGAFDDSYAYLSGTFPANQSATATIHLESGITASYLEVELLLRWSDSAHNSTGYECNLAFNGQYAEIIKWPGPLGKDKSEFKFISSGNPVSGGVHDGDVFQADVVGNVITSRLNGKVIAKATDDSIPSGGAPGIGFFAQGAPASKKFSFTDFSARGL